jgi:hypothetical protein
MEKILSESKVPRRYGMYNEEYLELNNIRAIKYVDCVKQTNVYRISVWGLEGNTSFVSLV